MGEIIRGACRATTAQTRVHLLLAFSMSHHSNAGDRTNIQGTMSWEPSFEDLLHQRTSLLINSPSDI
jgi:hypothetical protein